MKRVTFNRAMIAIVLTYFPIATIGATGSLWRGVQALMLLLAVLWLGFSEGQQSTSKATGGQQ